jgi:hypothetical protein
VEARRPDPSGEPRTGPRQLGTTAGRPWQEPAPTVESRWRPPAPGPVAAPRADETSPAAARPGPQAGAPEPQATAGPGPGSQAGAGPAATRPAAEAGPGRPAAAAEPETTADPFATGPFPTGWAWHSDWHGLDTPRPEPPTRHDDPSDWGRAAPSSSEGSGLESTQQPGGTDRDAVGRGPERRVLSAAEAAWGTRDFVHRPDTPEPGEAPPHEAPPYGGAPGEAPPHGAPPYGDPPHETAQHEAEDLPFRTAWPGDQRRAPGVAWPPAEAPQPFSFPSEEQLLKRPPRWERLLRRTPIPVPGEGRLRRAPSARDRERQRAMLRFGALVLVILLVGGGLWLASGRDKPAGVATGGESPRTTASPVLTSVQPRRVLASTQSGSRIAGNVLDGKTDTFWSRLAPSDDNQPYLRFFFDRRHPLTRIAIASGASGSEFSRRPRPREIELRFSDSSTVRTTLADRKGFQTVRFSPREVGVVRLVVLSTYPSAGPQRTSISEVKFFATKN